MLCRRKQGAHHQPIMFMIKGCQRRIILVKETNSKYFDSAYFVLRSDVPSSARDSDMLAEAHRMIDSYNAERSSSHTKKKLKAGTAVMITVLCLALAALIAAGIIIILF